MGMPHVLKPYCFSSVASVSKGHMESLCSVWGTLSMLDIIQYCRRAACCWYPFCVCLNIYLKLNIYINVNELVLQFFVKLLNRFVKMSNILVIFILLMFFSLLLNMLLSLIH